MDNLYYSLDEAREEIKKRWNDEELKKKIEEELGENFMPIFKDRPRGVIFRQICQADISFEFFFHSAKYINTDPLVIEYHDDIFVHFNEEKKGLGRLRVKLENGTPAIVDIMNFYENEKKKLGECVLKTGEKLVDFHHKLFEISKYPIELKDMSDWFHRLGRASDYYYPYLLHFVAHGVLFEFFVTRDEEDWRENVFTNNIVMPIIEKIKNKFGIKPLIIKLFPDYQGNKEEDFYWWSYPPHINDYIINYAKKHNLFFQRYK